MSVEQIKGTTELKHELLSSEEGQFLDYKETGVTPSKLQKHFVAFANTDGGELLVGISDRDGQKRKVRGFSNPEDANAHIQVLLGETEPAVEGTDVELIDFDGAGWVVHFLVPKSPQVHYASDSRCYIRRNASTRRIKGSRVTRLSHSKGSYSYERVLVDHMSADELIAGGGVTAYLDKIGSSLSGISFLKKNRLVAVGEDGELHPTVASVLLFDRQPQAALDTRCAVKTYRLHTTDPEYKREHLKQKPKTIEGSIIEQIRGTLSSVSDLLETAQVSIGGKLQEAEYPIGALKEIIVNAILHRDYSLNDDVHVRIFDNRIEVQSPGRLPGYITVENILDERYARNPNVVRAVHKLPDAPNYDIGEGLDTAYNLLEDAGLVEPDMQELDNAFMVVVKHKKLASLQELAMEFLEDNEFIRNRDLRKVSGEESENKVKKALQKLRKDDLIVVHDPNASRFKYKYRLTEKGEKYNEHK